MFQGFAPGSRLRSLQPRYLVFVVLGLLLFNAFATRITLPWRLGITNDEAHHHLESWRNRYRTEKMNPVFLRKLERMNRLSSEQMDLVKRVYFASPIVQRLTLFS